MQFKIHKQSIPQYLLYLTIISAFPGSYIMSVELGSIHLFPYRYLLIILCLIFIAEIYANSWLLNVSQMQVRIYMKYLAIWMFYAFISIMWAADKSEAIRNIIFLFTGIVVIFFMVFYFNNLNYLKWLYNILLLIFVAMLPIALWETVTGNHLSKSGMFGVERLDLASMPSVFFRNPNDYAAYIALTTPMFFVWIRYHQKLLWRMIGILILIITLWVLMMTTSRSCYLALLTGFAFWFIFILKLKPKLKMITTCAVICILLIVAIPDMIQNSMTIIGEQMSSLSSFVSEEGDPEVRSNLIKNALYFSAQSAGFGVGAGNVEHYMEFYSIYPVGRVTNVHNWWAEILANYGIFIFAGYVIFYISIFLNLWRAYKRVIYQKEKMICEALLVGLVSFFMASISSSSIIAFPPQWIFFGFCLAFLNYLRNKELPRAYPYHTF